MKKKREKASKEERKKQILTLLYMEELTQTEISKILEDLSKSWINDIVKEMINNGLIEIARREGRKIYLKITEKGINQLAGALLDRKVVLRFIKNVLSRKNIHCQEKKKIEGIEFDLYAENYKLFIKILDGVIVPEDYIVIKKIHDLPGERFPNRSRILNLLMKLSDHKGVLLSIINLARREKKNKYLVIIRGNHPTKWPDEFVKTLEEIAKNLNWKIIIGARKRLENELKKIPHNIKIIHLADITINDLENKILEFLQESNT